MHSASNQVIDLICNRGGGEGSSTRDSVYTCTIVDSLPLTNHTSPTVANSHTKAVGGKPTRGSSAPGDVRRLSASSNHDYTPSACEVHVNFRIDDLQDQR